MKSKFSMIIIFLFLCLPVLASRDIKIISSSASSIVVEYTPVIVDTSEVIINGMVYKNFNLFNTVRENDETQGIPEIPVRLINVGVPSEFGNTIQILSSSYNSIEGKIVPSQTAVKEDGSVNYRYILNEKYNEYKPGELVTFDNFGYVRELPVQKIKISPVQFDPVTNKIKFYNRIVFKINFPSADANNLISDNHVKDVVINFEAAKNWGRTNTSLKKTKAVENSVLAQGTWYRFKAPVEGIYKISRSELSALGIDPAAVDPRTIKIYNNGGYVLPEKQTAKAPSDLVENAILVVGEEDGVFNESDYILFYGRGVDFWEYGSNSDLWEHDKASDEIIRRKHWYTKNNYYWITSGGNTGKRIENKNSLNETNVFQQTTTQAFAFVDDDKTNVIQSGRVYLGDKFTPENETITYVNPLDHILPNSEIEYTVSFANGVQVSGTNPRLTVYENDKVIYSSNLQSATGTYEHVKLTNRVIKYTTTLPENRSVVKFNFDIRSNTSDEGYLDYLEIRYTKSLNASSDYLVFFSKDTSSVNEYTVSNFSNSDIHVFDVTDFSSVKKIANMNISGGQCRFQVRESAGRVSKYIAVNANSYKQIQNIESAGNSNIHGITQGAGYVIITDKTFADEANRLKDYRENEAPAKLNVQIIFIDEIINEFGGGLIDPTAIRNFIKYAYENWNEKPFYVLLFGDGSYDYLKTEGESPNFVYTYQSLNSYDEVSSYTADDYFGRIAGNDKYPDVSMARLNITSKAEGNKIVDKIINYEKGMDKGTWRNSITLVADDNVTSRGADGIPHVTQSESIANGYIPKSFNIKKIYIVEYPTVLSGVGRKKPTATDALVAAVNSGSLMINYQGHGSPNLWADEEVFNRTTTIPRFQNNKYFFLTAATCDFGWYDKPSLSGAEELLLLENRGMIGSLVSSRPVFADANKELAQIFYSSLFPGLSTTLEERTVGEAYFLLKQERSGSNDEKFFLMCDPAISLNAPKIPAQIDSINGIAVSGNSIQIKALSTVSISGSVRNLNNEIDNTFEGEGFVTVFDAEKEKVLKDFQVTYEKVEQGGVIFNGRVSVENGKFQTAFVVPKDITYENKNGKIVAYIFNEESDGVGSTTNIIVGGTDTTVVNDNKGPEIEVFYDDFNFENSYLVNPDFKLLAKLNDETGLNTTGTGVGHKLEGILNDDVENPIDFSTSFIGDLNSGGKSGVIEYNFFDKEPGSYKIKIKAWDVFNNLSETESFFTIVNEGALVLRDVVNYPNPFSSTTHFTFQQNLDQLFNVKIKIYTIAGRLIKEIEEHNILDKFVKIPWDGRDEDGSVLANGTYLYKLIVETVDSQYKENILGKLAIIK